MKSVNAGTEEEKRGEQAERSGDEEEKLIHVGSEGEQQG